MNKVLIIDDEEITRKTFSEVLRQYHFSTFEACDGRSGIGIFETEMPDAVLLDLQMPGMDGIETMQEMRKIDPNVPIIFVTAHGDIPTAVEAVKMGAYDFIVKPPDYKMLVLAIDRAVAQLRLKRESAAVGTQFLETEAANRKLKRRIAEQKRAEDALRKSEKNYRNLVETMSEGLGVQDKKGLITFMNKRACEMLGYELEELIGKPTTLVFDKENQEILREQMAQRREGKRQSYEIAWTRKDGGKIFTTIAPSPLFDERGNFEGSVAVFTDITERKRAEGELVRLYQQVKEEAEISGSLLQMVEALNKSLDERELIKTVTNLAPKYLRFDRIGIFLSDESVRGFTFSGGYGFSPAEEGILLSRNFKSGDFPAMDKAIAGETIIVENARETDLISKELVDTFGIIGAVIVPIIAREKVIGGIYGDYKTLRPIEKREVSFLKGLADGIAIALENARLYEELQQLLVSTIKSLASAIDAKSPWTQGHSERVTQYALQIGSEMGLKEEELERLKLSGLLHDVGKIGTYDILLDKPGELTDEEFELVKKHPGKGLEILAPIKQLSDVIPGILHHHERYDGRGYPDGLKGEKIPLYARILCVADSFDSMTADRPYRPSPGKEYAISEFRRCSGTQYAPDVVKAFLKVLGRPEEGSQ